MPVLFRFVMSVSAQHIDAIWLIAGHILIYVVHIIIENILIANRVTNAGPLYKWAPRLVRTGRFVQ